VSAIAKTSTTIRAATVGKPKNMVATMKRINAMKLPTMNTSPWAKFTIPIIPKTIVYPMAINP